MKRATFIIFEEFALIPRNIMEKVVEPMSFPRPAPFFMSDKYGELVPPEQTKLIYISSAGYKSDYIWEAIKTQITEVCNGADWSFFAFDYSIALYHKRKTPKDIIKAKKTNDEVSFLIEYCNIMFGESAGAFFSLELMRKAQKIRKPFYPLDSFDLMSRIENSSYKEKEENEHGRELRILVADIATSAGKDNDNTCLHCIRAIPTADGYRREFVYQVVYNGMNTITQCINIKRLFYDFQADYFVLDLRNNGDSIYNELTQTKLDEETGIVYDAWTVVDDDKWFVNNLNVIEGLRDRTLEPDVAVPVIFPIAGNTEVNHNINVDFKQKIRDYKVKLLLDSMEAESMLQRDEDYVRGTKQVEKLAPFVQCDEFIKETIQLEVKPVEGRIKLVEPNGARKDRYSSASYGNYFITILESDLLKEEIDWDVNAIRSLNTKMAGKRRNSRLINIMR